ncbi:unnamed protein product [Polarella glacialis]|uniref:Uncharacterized protein n=1 Tax=Polarella glacialis TaxID=89957 RepID=A0A813I1T3_POLGL|nr:unnamed protein product [Polarella glacialis]
MDPSSLGPFDPTDQLEVDSLKESVLRAPAKLTSGRIRAVLSAWKRWARWASDPAHIADLVRPGPIQLAGFLKQVTVGGPTAAASVWNALRFWNFSLGASFPLDHFACADFKLRSISHQQQAATELAPWEFVNLLRVAETATGTRRILFMMCAFVASVCIRWEHLQRSKRKPGTEEPFFECAQGKRRVQGARPGYDWAMPAVRLGALDLWRELRPFWDEEMISSFLIPAVHLLPEEFFALTSSSPVNFEKPMSRPRFLEVMRCLLVEAGVPVVEAMQRKFNCLRRFLPTAANVLEIPDRDAQAVGSWAEVPQGGMVPQWRGKARQLMSYRYAGAKTSRSQQVKSWIIARLWQLLKAAQQQGKVAVSSTGMLAPGSFTWAVVAEMHATTPMVRTLDQEPPEPEEKATGLEQEGIVEEQAEEKDNEAAPTDSSSEESIDRPSEAEAEPFDAPVESLTWFKQGKKAHIQSGTDADIRRVPWCRDSAFAQDPVAIGEGLDGLSEDEVCSKCCK